MTGAARDGRGRWRPLAERLVDKPAAPDERAFHADVAKLDSRTLRAERQRLRLAALLSDRLDWWALERLSVLTAELAARESARDGAHRAR